MDKTNPISFETPDFKTEKQRALEIIGEEKKKTESDLITYDWNFDGKPDQDFAYHLNLEFPSGPVCILIRRDIFEYWPQQEFHFRKEIRYVLNTHKPTTIDVEHLIRLQPFKEPSRRIKKWMLIKLGNAKPLVKRILGEPDSISEEPNGWTYKDGNINFDNNGMVCDYSFRFLHSTTDLSRWNEIKNQMTKSEVVSILGDPYSVTIDPADYDDNEETWHYYQKSNQAVIGFDPLGKIKETRFQSIEDRRKLREKRDEDAAAFAESLKKKQT
jgi:hypothetical protein